jgi:hypothetical protein
MSYAKLEVRMESLLPFLQGTCTPYNMPVYPGAQRKIAKSLIEPLKRKNPNCLGSGRVTGKPTELMRET